MLPPFNQGNPVAQDRGKHKSLERLEGGRVLDPAYAEKTRTRPTLPVGRASALHLVPEVSKPREVQARRGHRARTRPRSVCWTWPKGC